MNGDTYKLVFLATMITIAYSLFLLANVAACAYIERLPAPRDDG
jgi:hypothetical protein